ncbi:MAG: hypothetical protein ACRD3E_20225, partial [Terriglobales bacterium]
APSCATGPHRWEADYSARFIVPQPSRFVNVAGQTHTLASHPSCGGSMAENSGVRASLIILLVVAALMILVGWFVWSYKSRKPVPTSPKASTRLLVPRVGRFGTGAEIVTVA